MQAAAVAIGDEQVVVLELAGEAYGVEIGRVQEIIRMQPITRIPNGPAFIEGVTNLRGRVIPVLDLRKRFGLDATATTRRSRIVVGELGAHTVGLVVDGVSEVLRVPAEAVEPPSTLVTSADSAFLRGVAKLGERLILQLDLSRILTRTEQDDLAA
ncbi:MAG: chemotaxis protein CheW [Chloroflexi bacterium]|nr:chemotaxis protein CheW [Chloroflexota bacterium]